jgi:hypothetical protein
MRLQGPFSGLAKPRKTLIHLIELIPAVESGLTAASEWAGLC